MKIAFYPFFSTQDKSKGQFRLQADSGVRLYTYCADRAVEAGWDTTLILPDPPQCSDSVTCQAKIKRIPHAVSVDNLDRRLHWNPKWLRQFEQYDVVCTQHEFLPYPLRCLNPKLKIVVECGLRPETAYQATRAMFALAYDAADAVHFNSQTLADESGHRRKFVWKFGYDPRIKPEGLDRDFDVLFPGRASATNYTNHELFIEAMSNSGLRARMTDPTNYLRKQGDYYKSFLFPSELSRNAYLVVLQRSRVVVSLATNGYAPYAFQEAVASGCIAVCPRSKEYIEVLGEQWPYYCELTPDCIRFTVKLALQYGMPDIVTRINESSYSEAWNVAKHDLESL